MNLKKIPSDVYDMVFTEQTKLRNEKKRQVNLPDTIYRIVREWFSMKYSKK